MDVRRFLRNFGRRATPGAILPNSSPSAGADRTENGGYAKEYRPAFEFDADGMSTAHDSSFLLDPRFREAYAFGLRVPTSLGDDLHIEWRVWIALWAAEQALQAEGDFVECGVYTGIISGAVCRWTNFASHSTRRFWLVDTFDGLPEHQLREDEKEIGLQNYNSEYVGKNIYDAVVKKFAAFPNARIVRGEVPSVLSSLPISKVAYLSLDMNMTVPEMAALDHFWPLLAPGGVVLLDDYNWKAHRVQRLHFNLFFGERGVPILGLPTGQGLIIKPFDQSR